jgi:hypothetical protein
VSENGQAWAFLVGWWAGTISWVDLGGRQRARTKRPRTKRPRDQEARISKASLCPSSSSSHRGHGRRRTRWASTLMLPAYVVLLRRICSGSIDVDHTSISHLHIWMDIHMYGVYGLRTCSSPGQRRSSGRKCWMIMIVLGVF